MTPLEQISEWRKGCSCSRPGKPEECLECTRGLIEALEKSIRRTVMTDTKGAGDIEAIK